jgi:hypothetical protein
VFKCSLCERWFCDKHIEPRLAFIIDFNAMARFPELRVMFDGERNRENGHPDFEYSRKRLEELDIEEKKRNELIKQALDRMNHYYAEIPEKPIDLEADRKKRVEILQKEEEEIEKNQKLGKRKEESELYYNPKKDSETIALSNGFVVPSEVYSNATYREYLDHAKTMKSVKVIVDEYYKKYGKRGNRKT